MAVALAHPVRDALLLRHAAAEDNDLLGLRRLGVRQLAQRSEHALLRVLADGAGVEQHHVGARGVARRLVAHLREHPRERLAVGDVLPQ